MRASGAGRQPFATLAEFAHDVRGQVADHLAPSGVFFRGSVAEGSHDEYSDVDLLARIGSELNEAFFYTLEHRLTELYGPALVRYDPNHKTDLDSQHVRFSFYDLPVFWRVDLEIVSLSEATEKWPSPFPEWQVGTSALMNVVWAVKYHRRGRVEEADHYIASACEKLGTHGLPYKVRSALRVLEALEGRSDVDRDLLAMTRGAVRG